MSAVGTRRSADLKGFEKHPLFGLASRYADVAKNILNEAGVDLFEDPKRAVNNRAALDSLRDFFINESCDVNDPMYDTPEALQEHMDDMNELFLNNVEALREYAAMNTFNPVVGMTFPIHKNILMNTIFDKGAIPKFVAREPKFTVSMEKRILVTPDGKEIDMFLEQNKIYDAVESTAPLKDTIIALPEVETVDVLSTTFGNGLDRNNGNLSIESSITQVLVESYVQAGEKYWDDDASEEKVADAPGKQKVWMRVRPMAFKPSYGELDRSMTEGFQVVVKEESDGKITNKVISGVMTGYTRKNMFTILCSSTEVTKIKLTCRLDTSNAMVKTCSARWEVKTDIVEIPNARPINVPMSPEEVKDVAALYQVNQLTKIMSMIKLVLENYKDDAILKFLDNSFQCMPASNKISRTYDFAPREGYYADHVKWRQDTFMDTLDDVATYMYQVLNDPNMTITVIGSPNLIRKITPTEYTYQSPSNIGPVALDFQKTVVTSDKRVYNFISSDKLRNNKNLILLLVPRNTERIVYRIYDYQLYVSNEIRNAETYTLPAVHAFERFKCVEYQPVQGRLGILNPTGLRDWVPNDDPIGVSMANEYNSMFPEGYDRIPENPPIRVDHVNPNGAYNVNNN